MQRLESIARYALLTLWVALAFSTALVEISLVTALIATLSLKIIQKNATLILPKEILLPLFVYLFFCFLSCFGSDHPAQSFRGLLKALKYASLLIMVSEHFVTEKSRKQLEWVILVSATVIAFDALFQYCLGYDFIRKIQVYGAHRLTASFKTSGLFANYILLTLPLIVGLGFRFHHGRMFKQRLWIITLAPTLFVLLILSQSRGALLAFILSSFAALFLQLKRRTRILTFIVFLALIITGHRPILSKLQSLTKHQSVVERMDLGARAIQVIRAKPFLGTGINTYAASHKKYDAIQKKRTILIRDPILQNPDGSITILSDQGRFISNPYQTEILIKGKKYGLKKATTSQYYLITDELVVDGYYAHNGYLQLAAETGLFTLVSFLFFIFTLFKVCQSSAGHLDLAAIKYVRLGIIFSLTNFLIFTAVDTILHNSLAVIAFWFMAGLLYVYSREPSRCDP